MEPSPSRIRNTCEPRTREDPYPTIPLSAESRNWSPGGVKKKLNKNKINQLRIKKLKEETEKKKRGAREKEGGE